MPATLADIQRKYGDSVYPLYKDEMHAPYMEAEPVKNLEKELVTKTKSIYRDTKSITQTAKILGVTDRKMVSQLLKKDDKEMEDTVVNGYRGVILHDEAEDKVQCSECGKWFRSLSTHIKVHSLTGREYKDKHGLFYKVALCSKKLSNDRSKSALKHNISRKNLLKGYKHEKNSPILTKAIKKTIKKMQFKNTYALCDAQIAARLQVVKDMSGKKKINSADIKRFDRKLYQSLIDRYSSISNASKKMGFTQVKPTHRYEDSELIAKLRYFVIEKKRMPRREDSRAGTIPTDKVFSRVFGSWRRAKTMAGLDQLLAEVKSK